MKRATSSTVRLLSMVSNFNPRPHEEGDTKENRQKVSALISIHALMKRATPNYYRHLLNQDISIHALMKRATHKHTALPFVRHISIHALMKRATL